MNCPSCNSRNIVKNGYYNSYQKYQCKDCGKQFSERSLDPFCRHRFPNEVIKNTILCGFFVSTRNSVFMIKEMMSFGFSHQTSYNWSKKFAKLLDKLVKKLPNMNISSIWHVDEKFIRVRGSKDKFAYLWVVMDTNNNILAVHVSMRRDCDSAKKVFRLAKENTRMVPEILVSDGLQGYKKAVKKIFGRKCKHVVAHFEAKGFMHKGRILYLSNNRIESLNSKINLWYKKSRGFKKLETARLWCLMFMHFYNHLRPRVIPHERISLTEALVLCH